MYALGVAAIYLFVAFVVMTFLALVLQALSLHLGPQMAQAMTNNSMGLVWVAHACLIGFLTVGTIRWNFGGLAQLRRNRRQVSLPHPPPLPVLAPMRSQAPRGPATPRHTPYTFPPFAQQDPWSAREPSVLREIVRSYPVVGG